MTCATLRAAAAALLLGVPLLVGCGSGGEDGSAGSGPAGHVIPPGESTDGLTITMASDPDPLTSGDNALEVTVKAADGTPVTDATVTMVFSMPAMPAMNMPAMRSEAALAHEAEGRYRGAGQLEMGGTWNVAITVARGGEELGGRRFSVVARD